MKVKLEFLELVKHCLQAAKLVVQDNLLHRQITWSLGSQAPARLSRG